MRYQLVFVKQANVQSFFLRLSDLLAGVGIVHTVGVTHVQDRVVEHGLLVTLEVGLLDVLIRVPYTLIENTLHKPIWVWLSAVLIVTLAAHDWLLRRAELVELFDVGGR